MCSSDLFPQVTQWAAVAKLTILDPKIDVDILREHLIEAGQFTGFGSMRVENGGTAGRFAIDELQEI